MLYSERLLYTNANNESINIGYDYDLIPINFSDDVDNALNTTKYALQHGTTLVSSSLNERLISITITYAIRNAVAIENEVLRVVNPTIEGTLYKINTFGTRFIKVMPMGKPKISRTRGRGEIVIDLKACDPFYQTENVVNQLANHSPRLRFPLYWATTEQRLFGVQTSVFDTEIQNKGDVNTGFIVIFKANGDVVNPSIINNATGDAIHIKYSMKQGDEVRVINMPFTKQVYVNGVKLFTALDRANSNFFDLVVGKNSLKVNADENVLNLTTLIEYAPKYL